MRKRRIASVAFTGVAVAAGAGFQAPAAFAASTHTWTVNPGGTTKGSASVTQLKDVNTGASLKCNIATATAAFSKTTYTQSGSNSFKAAALTGTFGSPNKLCASSLGGKFLATLKAGTLNAKGQTGTVTSGKITGISASIKGTSGFGCTATVTGSTTYKYNSTSGALSVTGSSNNAHLTVTAAKSCAGQLNVGNNAFFQGIYFVSPIEKITKN